MLIFTGRQSLAPSVPLNLFGIRVATTAAHHGNVVFSPLSIAASLAFLQQVTTGGTAAEIEKALTWSSGLEIADFRRYLDGIALGISGVEAVRGSRCWIDAAWMDPATALEMTPDIEIRSAHFGDPAAVANEVNAWVREVTRGVITTALSAGDIPPQTRMLLSSTLYLKASWFLQFPPAATRRGVFRGLHGDGPAMMMENTVFALYQADDMAEYVEVPYTGTASFRIVLPRAGVALGEAWRHLAEVPTFGRAAVAPPYNRVKLRLPRFTIDWRSDLAASLGILGVRRVFAPDTADFSPIAPPGTLFVGGMLHQSMIRVCESGTEAGAVTATAFTGSSAVGPPTVIEVDRPFIFDIVEHASGGVLLCGQMTDASHDMFPSQPDGTAGRAR